MVLYKINDRGKHGFSYRCFILYLLALFFLTPFGFQFGTEVIWAVDFFSIAIVSFILLTLFIKKSSFKMSTYDFNLPLFFLILFFLLEFVLPIIGVIVWDDLSAATSSLRALIFWGPLLALFPIMVFREEIRLSAIDKVFFIAVIANFVLGLIELSIYLNILPENFNYRIYLSDFAPQKRFLDNRIMSFGFFQNSTAYGVFGFIGLVHCFCRILQTDSSKYRFYFFAFLSFSIIVLSTSRVPLFAAFISFFLFLIFLRRTQWNLFLSFFLLITGSLILISLFSLEFTLFSRFTRLIEGGLQGDYSLNQRITIHWPRAINLYYELGHPTFTNPSKYAGLIDSGYLTYLLQGGGVAIFVLAALLFTSFFSSLKEVVLTSGRDYYSYFLLFLSVYLLVGMLISNPMRSPLVIAFLSYAVFGFSSRKYSGERH